MSRRPCQTGVATLLLLGLLLPLVGSATELVEAPPCHMEMETEAPTPPASSDGEPCDGNILLTCCDGVTLAQLHDPRFDVPVGIALPWDDTQPGDPVGRPTAIRPPPNLAWLTSLFRLSVILRV